MIPVPVRFRSAALKAPEISGAIFYIKLINYRKVLINPMEERLKTYLAKMEEKAALLEKNSGQGMSEQEKKQMLDDMLIQIGFFQHERLIHLIVTVTFALLTIIAIMGTLIVPQPALFALVLLLLVLLIPYIRHYYILENGVQKLYQYYDKFVI